MALPCLSSAGADIIRTAAEALFERLLFLDGDGVWLLLLQTLDNSVRGGLLLPRRGQDGNPRVAAASRLPTSRGVSSPAASSSHAVNDAPPLSPWVLQGKDRSGGGGGAEGRVWAAGEKSSGDGGSTRPGGGVAWTGVGEESGGGGMLRSSQGGGVSRKGGGEQLESKIRDGAGLLAVEAWLPPRPPSLSSPAALAGFVVAARPSVLAERRSVFGASETLAGECAPAAARLLGLLNTGQVAEHM